MEFKEAVKKLHEFDKTPSSKIKEKDVNEFLADIRPRVLKLRYGTLVMSKILECVIEYQDRFESPAYGNAASILKWSVIKTRLWPLSIVLIYPVSMYLIIMGIAVTIGGCIELHTALDSQNWKKIEAIVVKSTITKRTYDSKDSPVIYHYDPEIEYVYVVKGVTYASDRRNFQNYALDEPEAKSVMKRYPVDHPIHAYYNPQNPEESVLEREMDFTTYSLVFWGVIIFILGCIILLIRIIRRKKKIVRLRLVLLKLAFCFR